MIANVGNIGNDSASYPVVELANISHCPNEDSVDEGGQTEALDVVRGTFFNFMYTISAGILFCVLQGFSRRIANLGSKLEKPVINLTRRMT